MDEPKVNLSCGERIACISVTGTISVEELLEIVKRYYQLIGNRDVLWDFTQADLSKISDEHFAEIAAVAKMNRGVGAGRKTAYVSGDAATYARLCKYMNVAFTAGVPIEYSVFLNRDSAAEWLQRR